jgi:hypothetical protein
MLKKTPETDAMKPQKPHGLILERMTIHSQAQGTC